MEGKEKSMEWEKLLTKEKWGDQDNKSTGKKILDLKDIREKYPISPFEGAYEELVSSSAFRRLQDKTQVFPLSKSDFVRTRLTHSIEVSTIAKQLGIMCFSGKDTPEKGTSEKRTLEKDLNNIETILSCAGLLHDLGNPPFGHVGESIIGEWF